MPLTDTLLEEEDSELVAPQQRRQRMDAPLPRSRPRTFELSDDAEMQLKELARSTRPMQSAPAEQAKPEKPLGLMGTIREGAKSTMRALGATADTMQGDAQGVVQAAQEQAAAPKDPDLERFYSHIEEQKKALGDNPSLWEGIKAVGSAAIDNPRGFGLMVAEQLPNSGVALGAAGAGALAGSFAGPLGAAVGGLASLATANIGLETGAKALEAAADNTFTPEEQSRVRREGLVKGGVITGVDAATLGVTKFITNTSKRAVEHATTKALADRGVDITSATARKAAMQTPEIAEAVKSAQELAKQGAETLGKRLATTGGAVALETIGEGAGEYLGELAATGKANAVDAVIEGFAGLGTSIGEIAVTSALNRKGLNRLLDSQEEAQKTAEAETKETGVEHEAIPHPTEPEKFVAVPKVRSISGIELERDETGNLKPVASASTQADFNLANRPSFELTAEDKLRQRELEKARSPIIVPTLAGKPVTQLPIEALNYTVNRGSTRSREMAAKELERRKNEGDTSIPEKPEDTVTRIVATGAEKAQEDAKKIIVPSISPKVVKPANATETTIAATPEIKKPAKIIVPGKQQVKKQEAKTPGIVTPAATAKVAPAEKVKPQPTVKPAKATESKPVDTPLTSNAQTQPEPKPASVTPEAPAPIRQHIDDLIKRRAASKETGKERSVNNAINRAKEFMEGKRTDTTLESKWFRVQAAAMRKSDPETADILGKISEEIKSRNEDQQQAKKEETKAPKASGQPKRLDHGELNVKGRTNNLNKELDRYKKEQAELARTKAKASAQQKREEKALAKALLNEHEKEILEKHKAKFGEKELKNTLDQWAKWEPQKLISFVDRFIQEKAGANEKTEKEKPAVAVRGDQKPVPRGGRILANGIAETIQKEGVAALVGQKITSPERLAELAQVYRNPQYETFRIFLTKGNEIVQASGVTARLPGSSPIFPKDMTFGQGSEWIKGMMQTAGADGYWMLHNHPSGDPTPSPEDVRTTQILAQLTPGFKGHVVINSNRYAQIMRRGEGGTKVITKRFGEDELLKASKPSEYIGKQIPSPKDVVPIGKSFQKEGWITLIGVSGVSGVRAIAEIPLKTFTTPMLARAAIRRFGRKSGAESVFAYGKESDLKAGNAAALTREGFLRSAVNEEGRSHGIGNPTKISFGRESGTGRMEVRQGKAKALQTDSLAFRRWFGKSKVVDKDGKPLVVYHGTASDFSKFGEDADVDFAQKLTGTDGEFYFTDDAALASDYAQEQNIGGENANVMPVYLSLSNPLIVDAKGLTGRDTFRFIRERIGDMAEGKNDGLIIHNVNDKIGDHNNPNATIYIARNRNQIKSAIGNRGTFDDSGFILNQNQAPFASKAPVRARMDKITDSLIYNFQDRFKPLKDIQKRAGPVAEDEDAALAEERYSGIVRARMDTFEEQMRDPLITAIHDSGVSYENAEEYLHALHAPSRNAAMREINPTEDELKTQISALEKQRDTLAKDKDVEKFVNLRRELRQAQADVEDGIADESLVRGLQSDIAQIRRQQNIKDYAEALDKLKALRLVKPFKGDNTALSGMSDKQAKDIIAKADKNGTRAKLDKVSAIVDSITARTRQIYVEGGLEKADAIDAWNQKYEHYVPLHRDEVGGNTMPKVGQGFNIRGKESKRATGSTKQVTDILAHVVAQHEAAIIRSEKARVDRALFQFASTHPDPSLWTLDDAPKLRTVDPVSGFVVERVDPTYKNRPEVLTLKIDGEEHTITFNTQNQEAMRLAASMKNLSSQELGEVTQLVGRVTRFLATMNTTMNPVFVARNFMRDMQTTFVNLSDTEIAAKKREVFRDIPAAIKGMWNLSRGKGNSQWAKYAQEFKAAGGQTGWMEHYKDIGTRAEALKKELAVMKPGKLNLARRTGKAWLNLIEDANNAVENGARLSAYVNARRSGLSEGKAAQLAKNLTVNFNARGAKSVELNAWYMFMNASIQGSARLIKAMGNRQVRKITAGIILSGFLMDIMARSMAGDDDEDGENDYDQLPEHTKAMNFVFMVGGQPVTVPMPYGYNFFASAGRKVSEMMFRENYSPVRSAADLAAVFLDAFSPTGQAGSALQFAAPTVADPFVQWAENKNFAGNPLRKDQNNFGPPKPEFQMGFKSTSAPAKWLAEALNDTTGGNEVRPGFVNVSPVFFDFAVSSILGGAGRTYLQIASGPLKAVGDDEIQAREIPFANIFVGARPEYQTERKYFDAVGEVELADKELRTYMQKGDTEMVREIREEHGNLLRLRESAKITKELLARLRKRDLALDKQDPPNKAQLRREIEEKKREAMSRFNKKYREAVTAEG